MGRNSLKLNEFEYDFMMGDWQGVKGAAYNQCYEFCQESGYIDGFHPNGNPKWTNKGRQAIVAYQSNENSKLGDMI